MTDDAELLLAHAAAMGKDVEPGMKYAELARLMHPVTAETLRATDDRYGRTVPLLFRQPASEARIWSRKLALWTAFFAVAIVFIENYQAILTEFYARDEYTSGGALTWHALGVVLGSVVPFAYGGLGAAAYLLRAAHDHLHARTFDPRFIPEYYSRMLLGVIAGGAIQLLITQVADDGAVVSLSAAALAFVAGYNSDLLFNTVERVSAALLPKVGVGSLKRAETDPMAGVTVTDLIRMLDEAKTEEAREAVRGVLAAMQRNMGSGS